MFSLSSPLSPALLGSPVPISGTFPVTVAASPRHSLVCVGTTGALAGVSCARFTSSGIAGAFDALRPFDLGQAPDAPPTGGANTLSHVFFSADETVLLATVKGDPAANKTGFIAAFPVSREGAVSAQGAMSSPEGTAVLFGAAAVPGTGDVLVTDASFGAAVVGVSGAREVTLKGGLRLRIRGRRAGRRCRRRRGRDL